jgi:predicted PurR-regulated permease PerM
MLLPFVIGLGLAYLLDPVVDRLEKLKLSRQNATFIVLGSFFAVFGFLMMVLLPVMYEQALDLVNNLPSIWHKLKTISVSQWDSLLTKFSPEEARQITSAVGQQTSAIAGIISSVVEGMWRSGMVLVNILSMLFVMPLVAFYCLRDWDRMTAKIHDLLPRRHADTICALLRDMDRVLSGFLHGQFMVCLLLSAYYCVSLNIAGLHYAMLVGVASGFLVFIPYIGTFVAMITALGIAYVQYESLTDVTVIAAIYLAAQFVEGNFITPRVVGNRVGLHPAWIIFGMLAGGTLMGLVGVLIAVPATAIIGVLTRFAVAEYVKSQLYLGVKKEKKKNKKAEA